jgi:hypothetical protein
MKITEILQQTKRDRVKKQEKALKPIHRNDFENFQGK